MRTDGGSRNDGIVILSPWAEVVEMTVKAYKGTSHCRNFMIHIPLRLLIPS
jgi:hypothetical protein